MSHRRIYSLPALDTIPRLKIALIGNSSVGKTSIMLRFTDNTFNDRQLTTLGVHLRYKQIVINDQAIKLQIWDTAGQERFRAMTVSFYRGVSGIIFVYDVTDPQSLLGVETWIQEVLHFYEDGIPAALVGNKIDLEKRRAISSAQGLALAQKYSLPFFEVSAKSGAQVEECLLSVVRAAANTILELPPTSLPLPPAETSCSCGN